MIEWLRTSIPGIILLGAAGSILAMALLKVSRTVIYRILMRFGQEAHIIFVQFFRVPYYVLEHLRSSTDVRELIVTSVLLLAIFILWTSVALISAMFMAVGVALALNSPTQAKGFPILLGASFFFFFNLLVSGEAFGWLMRLYTVHMKNADREAVAKAHADATRRFSAKG